MKCVSSCFSCLCGNKSSARVTPSDSRDVIQPGETPEKTQARVVSVTDGRDGGRTNPNFEMGDGDGGNESVTDGNGPMKHSYQVKALFIEVGKDRLLRVIHIPSSDDTDESKSEDSASKKGSLENGEVGSGKKGGDRENGDHTEADEEEDEYWFSKWARKPRFRSIFAKNPDKNPLKITNENNNNAEESNKRKNRRYQWAYNNQGNGSADNEITQQPTINPSDEDEFNSISLVNTTKQQWSKNGSNNGNSSGTDDQNSPKTIEVQVYDNFAFQEDDDEERRNDKPEHFKTEENESPTNSNSHNATSSTASVKSSRSASQSSNGEEDLITSVEEDKKEKRTSPLGPPPDGYTINVNPKKPILFFIHSISNSSDVWHNQMEFFRELGYEIVVPDLLGHGLSSTPLNPKYYMFESLVQDLILIFDHFTKEDNKVVLIGHGYGASLAAMLTRVRLKNVALFISIAGGGPTPLVRRTCCQESWLSWKCKLFHSNRVRGRFDNPELKHVLPPAIHQNVLLGQVWSDGDSAFYRRITVPSLLVYGMRDKVVTLVEECEMERSIPKSFLELIENAGHQIMQEQPDKLNKMLYKFISSWS